MNGHLHLSVNLNNEVEIKHAINILEIFYKQAYSNEIAKTYDVKYSIDKNTGDITKEVKPIITEERIQEMYKDAGEAIQNVLKPRDGHGRFAKKGRKK